MILSLGLLVASIITTILYCVLLKYEMRHGGRVVLVTVRRFLDRVFTYCKVVLLRWQVVISKFFWQLGWRYVVHVLLRTVLLMVARLYERMIIYFEYNRRQARDIKRDRKVWRQRGHLAILAHHKSETALSDTDKKILKQTMLDGN